MKINSNKIIIDGLDAAGKSTLARSLRDQFGFEVSHETKDSPNNMKWYKERYQRTKYVSDRSFLCERAFAPVFGRTPKINDAEYKELLQHLADNKVQVIIALNSPAYAQEILKERGEEFAYDYTEMIFRWKQIHNDLKKAGVEVSMYWLYQQELKNGEWVIKDERPN